MYTPEQKKLINKVLDEYHAFQKSNAYTLSKNLKDFKEKHKLNEPTFEVGKCYKSDDILFYIREIIEKKIFGFGFINGMYFNENYFADCRDIRVCTEIPREEFNKKLLDYAKDNFIGKTIESEYGTISKLKEIYINYEGSIFCETTKALVFDSQTGKFAKIIEEEQPTIILKVPKGSNYRVEEV